MLNCLLFQEDARTLHDEKNKIRNQSRSERKEIDHIVCSVNFTPVENVPKLFEIS